MLFDCLATGDAGSMLRTALPERRAALNCVMGGFVQADRVRLSLFTRDRQHAERWLEGAHGALDGVIAKRLDAPYAAGKRDMLKAKTHHIADCVVGGFRYGKETGHVGSLLLGLFNAEGRLDHVGFTSAINAAERPALTQRLKDLRGGVGFVGDAPGGPSRWATDASASGEALRPELVVEVSYDQVTYGRFRHGTMLLRWRPDKAPRQCTREQIGETLQPRPLVEAIL